MDFRFGLPVHPPLPQFHVATNQLPPVARPVFNGQYHRHHHPVPPPSSTYVQPSQLQPFFQGAPVPNYHFGAPHRYQSVPQPSIMGSPPLPPPPQPPPAPLSSVLATQIASAQVLSQIVNLSNYKAHQQQQQQVPKPRYPHKNSTTFQRGDSVFHFLLSPSQPQVSTHENSFQIFRALQISRQLESFFNWLQLSPDQIRLRWQIAFDMEYFLRQFYPRCQVYVFGSLLTDLGSIESDVDMYADLFGDDGDFIRRQMYTDTAAALLRDQVFVQLVQNNRCPHYYNEMFVEGVEVMGTRVPFLRFSHAITGIMCDLTFTSRISVQNSKLLNFYLNYDPRLGPLFIFLRYWARLHDVSGEMKIKKYALALLALVFFMRKGSIPNVELLQELGHKKRVAGGMMGMNPDFIEGWDASYCEDIGYVKSVAGLRPVEIPPGYPYSQPQQFLELCLDFFEMYSGVELAEVVICPLVGEVQPRDEFLVGPKMRDGKFRKMAHRNFGGDKKLGIQDPFVLTFNVGGIAKDETVEKFHKMCKLTWNKLKGERGRIKSILDFFIVEEPTPESVEGEGCNGK